MPTEEQIRQALRASRVVPLPVSQTHGPFGLEHLVAAVAQLANSPLTGATDRVQRPIVLNVATWAKLEQLAQASTHAQARHVSASEVATAIIEQFVATTAAAST